MMHIARLRISGFRGIRTADLQLGKTTVFVGPNSVGKTTVIEALALLLGRDGMVRGLTEHDFYGSAPQPADRIKIIATIVGFGHPNPDALPEWFAMRRGGVPKWYDPTTGLESATYRAAPYELACEIGFQARFDHTNLEVETCRYFCDDSLADDIFVDDNAMPVGIGLVRDIGFFLIPASRSWDRMLSFGSELFRRVVSSDNGLPSESILSERDRLRMPPSPLENDPHLKPVIDEVNAEIASLFGTGKTVQFRLTGTDSSSVLDAIVPHFEGGGGAVVPAKRQGSGLISLQSLFLLLHFGNRRIADGKGFCLALEEPELHLPPNLQRRVLRRLKALSTQIIVSTHSPLIAGFTEPTELAIISNDAGTLTAKPLLAHPLEAATPNAIRSLFQLKRVETVTALMAETVLVPEGVLDFEWLALLARITELQSDPNPVGAAFSSTVGIIPTQSSAVVETVRRMRAAHSRVVALVDGDPTGLGYAAQLGAAGASATLRWPDGWTIENAVGWVIQPSEAAVVEALQTELAVPPVSQNDLVARLKNDTPSDPRHLKGDRLAYEAIARAISSLPTCLTRTGELLDAIAAVGSGRPTPRFVQDALGIYVFQP